MLTFQSIRDVERAERESKRLQKLPNDWNVDVKKYFEAKDSVQEKNADDLLELQNVKGVVQRLLDLREKKIIDQALVTVRTGVPPENLLKVEEQLFWSIAESLRKFRGEWLGGSRTSEVKRYNVKQSVGPFVGPDLLTYSLKEGEYVSLPLQVAELLLRQGIIKEV
jgi:DNA replication initiation complex subunit (GINS family)